MGQIRYITKNFGKTKKAFEYRNRKTLNRFPRLKLGEQVPGSSSSLRWQVMNKPTVETEIITKERKLPSLAESSPPYLKTNARRIDSVHSLPTFYDPKFNPHFHDEFNKVSPDEEPFSAVYANSKSEHADQYTKVRNITTPELWNYVERLARLTIAPQPPRRKPGEPITKMPSGFVPPPEVPPDLPYFIARTRNYLLPVYFTLNSDPEECCTSVRQISGDIWKLEEDLRKHLESLNKDGNRILTSVHETDGRILFRGKHLNQAVDWIHSQGF